MTLRIKFSVVFHLLLACALVCATGCSHKADLKLHLKPGDQREVHLTQTVSVAPNVGGMKFEMGQTTEMTVRFEVQNVNAAGEAKAKGVFEKADLSSYMTVNGQAAPQMDALTGGISKALQAITDESFTCTLAPDGKVSDVEGMPTVAQKAAKNLEIPAGPRATMLKSALQARLNAMLSDSAMEQLWTNAFDMYPSKAVGVNDTWTKETVMPGSGMVSVPLTISDNYTVKAIQNGVVTVEDTSKITANGSSTTVSATQPFKLKDVKGSATGTADVDLTTGWIKRSSGTAKITANLDLGPAARFLPRSAGGAPTVNVEIRALVESS